MDGGLRVAPPQIAIPPSSTLAALSRNASTISSSSSSSSTSSLVTPLAAPRAPRTFSAPRSRSPATPTTPRAIRQYLPRSNSATAPNSPEQGNVPLPAATPRGGRSRNNSSVANGVAKKSKGEFTFGDELGSGSFSTVVVGLHLPTMQQYAVKILDKRHLIKFNKAKYAHTERAAMAKLSALNHQGIVRLHWTFQDEQSLYFVLDLARNGELFRVIKRLGSLNMECTRYYAAQIIDVVGWMHSNGVLHRDLKPENILLDDNHRVKIADFGSAKILSPEMTEESKRMSFVGTAHYVSPELLQDNIANEASDLWAAACIIFQMIAGRSPFNAPTDYLIFDNIKNLRYSFPEGVDADAKDLIEKILVLDPSARLGAGKDGIQAIKDHPFFKGINWSTIWTDPAPTFEAGLVKNEKPMEELTPLSWDNLMGLDDGLGLPGDELEGPEDTISEMRHTQNSHSPRSRSAPPARSSSLAASSTSSSEESPLDPHPSGNSLGLTHSRGRSTGFEVMRSKGRRGSDFDHGPNEKWSSLLHPGETTIFSTSIHIRTARRGLLPAKSRRRILVLTSLPRLLCIKEAATSIGGGIRKGRIVIKSDVSFRPQDGDNILRGVLGQAEKFVVQTSQKSFTYVAEDPVIAAKWISQIQSMQTLLAQTSRT